MRGPAGDRLLLADHFVRLGADAATVADLARDLEHGTAKPLYQAAEKPEEAA